MDSRQQDTRRFSGGRWLIVMATLLWSMSGLFAKSPLFEAWPEGDRGILFAFWRAAFASIVLWFLVRRVEWDWRLLVSALTFAFMNVTYLSSMVYCEATLAIWLQYTSPMWVLLISFFFFGERPTRKEWPDWTLICLGVLVVLFCQPRSASVWGIVLGLMSGLGFAGVVITLRWLRHLDGAWVVFVNHFFTALILLPLVMRIGIWPKGFQWGMLAGFGMLQMGLPYALFARAIKRVNSHEASALTLLEPMFVPVWVLFSYGGLASYQRPSFGTLAGASLILGGLGIRYLRLAWGARQTTSGTPTT
ncbi:MAG: EamA family transporter [Pirellulaceae bacterium]